VNHEDKRLKDQVTIIVLGFFKAPFRNQSTGAVRFSRGEGARLIQGTVLVMYFSVRAPYFLAKGTASAMFTYAKSICPFPCIGCFHESASLDSRSYQFMQALGITSMKSSCMHFRIRAGASWG